MRTKHVLVFALVCFGLTTPLRADFVIDAFTEPAGSHVAPSTYPGPFSAPQVATSRTLTLTGAGIAVVAGGGGFTALLLPGAVATITWTLPSLNLTFDPVVDFVGFTISGSTALISAAIDGTRGSIESQAWVAGEAPGIWLDHTEVGDVDTLSVSFTNTGAGILTITGDAVLANPEPATMTLLALGMSGIGATYWRRRRLLATPKTAA